ncbi:MAG: hypothetical protein HDQ99_03760 [Lachnospiraceae bacterium]|nr:hypothetical protein [Lachnospiraceae bacterium]
MKKDEVSSIIRAYKYSSAFITAYELGIFQLLKDEALSLIEISDRLNANEERLLLLLIILEEQKVLEHSENQWKLDEDLCQSYEILENMADIIHHEANIFSSLMYPAKVKQAIIAKEGQRDFDLKDFTKEKQKLYDNTMYGKSLKIIALNIMRAIRRKKNPTIIEYGRSRDRVLNELTQIGYQFQGFCMPDEEIRRNENLEWIGNHDRIIELSEEEKFDVILFYNTIHYYSKAVLYQKLTELKKILKQDTMIVVIDIFYEQGNFFTTGVLMDWLTHGGINFIKQESVEEAFKECNFATLKTANLKEVNCKMMIFQIQ